MKKTIILLSVLFTTVAAFSQLKGSGTTITKTFDYQNFDKVAFDDLDGILEIEVGKSFSISVTIDNNIYRLLSVSEDVNKKELTIALKGNQNNKKYIENTNILIKITMPFCLAVTNNGNANLKVENINTKNFKSENLANGNTKLIGNVEFLEVFCCGNGNLYAEQLAVQNATVICRGNGNAKVNVSDNLTGIAFGNGTIINIGAATFNKNSKTSGNGSLNGVTNY